jgi:hypothetical protein
MQELNNEFNFDPKSLQLLGILSAENPNFNIQTADWGEVGCLRRRKRADLEKERGIVTHLVLHDDDDGGGGGDDDAQWRW